MKMKMGGRSGTSTSIVFTTSVSASGARSGQRISAAREAVAKAAAAVEEAEVQLAVEASAREAREHEARERRGEGSSTEHHPEHAQQALEAEF